jgi:hypothetical protein
VAGVRCQLSDDKGQFSEVRGQRSENRMQFDDFESQSLFSVFCLLPSVVWRLFSVL